MMGVGIFALNKKEMSSSKCSTNLMIHQHYTNSLSVGLFVTQACLFDAAYTKIPATNITTPKCDLASLCVAKAASM
jgi:hypothetical protein